MSWFTRLCRQSGLIVHHLLAPPPQTHKQQVSQRVEEKKLNDTVTLRRTTIEEIEIKRDTKPKSE